MYVIIAAVLLALDVASVVQGQFNYGVKPQQRQARCLLPNTPCRLRIDLYGPEGDQLQNFAANTCACSSPNTCPEDWGLIDQVVSRSLISDTLNVTLSMMFCGPVQPERQCSMGETAMVVSGFLRIPNELDRYYCRCPGTVPLQLRERRQHNFKFYHTYVCDNHMATCYLPHLPCKTVRPDSTQYHCKCPGRSTCQTGDLVTSPTQERQGFCRF